MVRCLGWHPTPQDFGETHRGGWVLVAGFHTKHGDLVGCNERLVGYHEIWDMMGCQWHIDEAKLWL